MKLILKKKTGMIRKPAIANSGHGPGMHKVWISGMVLSFMLFLANYLVFQNLIQEPEESSCMQHHQGNVMTTSPPQPVAYLNFNDLEARRKREHIRTLVLQNFKELPENLRLKLFDVIYEQSLALGIDPYLTLSIIATESSFRERSVSCDGAYGLMQIKPIMAEEMACKLGIPWQGEETLFDPVLNITIGLQYLADLKDRFGDMDQALVAYNCGPEYVITRMKSEGKLPGKYIEKIKRNLEQLV